MAEDDSSPGDDIYLGDSDMEKKVYAEFEPRYGRFWIPVIAILVLIILIAALIILFLVVTF